MPTKLILIRHGETDWNYENRYCGFSDIPLNERGRTQARKLSERLKDEKISKVYSSDMKRSLQFAGIIFKNTTIEKLTALREMNFGLFEGLTYQEIMKRYSRIYRAWLDNLLDVVIPGGENLNQMAERVRKTFLEILSCNNGNSVAIFSHAGPIRVILTDILKKDLRDIWQIEQDLGAFNIVEFIKGRGRICILNG